MKTKEIRSMDKSTLEEKKDELKKELVKMNAQVAIGTALKNPGQVKDVKKTLARILTMEKENVVKNSNQKNAKNKKQPGVEKKA